MAPVPTGAELSELETFCRLIMDIIDGSPGIVAQGLQALVSQIPASKENFSPSPASRAESLGKSAALRAAAISGGFSLPPGPLGLATVLPDMLAVWRIQQQLVADIAAAHGRGDAVTRETMILCLFKHGGAAITQRLFSRQTDNIVVHRIANRALQQLLEKIAVRVGQRLAAKSVSRWLPILGALGAGAYAYYDTLQVGKNATELFSKPLHLEGPSLDATTSPAVDVATVSPTEGSSSGRSRPRSSPSATGCAVDAKKKPRTRRSPRSSSPTEQRSSKSMPKKRRRASSENTG